MYMCAGFDLHVGQELCHSHARHRAVACAQGHPRQLKGCGQDLQLALVTDVSGPNAPQFLAALLLLGVQGEDRYLSVRARSALSAHWRKGERTGGSQCSWKTLSSSMTVGGGPWRPQMSPRCVRSLTHDTLSHVRLDLMTKTMVMTTTQGRISELVMCQKVCSITLLRAYASAQALAWIRWAPLDPFMRRKRRLRI